MFKSSFVHKLQGAFEALSSAVDSAVIFPTFALRRVRFFQRAHIENINIVCKVLEGFRREPRLPVYLRRLFLLFSSVTSAAWYSHLSYRLNVKLKLFLLPALKRLRTLLLVASASVLLPLFEAFTVINDGVRLVSLNANQGATIHFHVLPILPFLDLRLQCFGEDRDGLHRAPQYGFQPRLSVFAHTRHAVTMPKSKMGVFACPGSMQRWNTREPAQ